MLAIAMLMAVWWMTEALPLGVTALLPLVMYPLLGIMKTSDVSGNYGHHLVFLFMGGFIISIALQEWQLHKRFAFFTISLIGENPRRIILAFMLSTALLSMWISNTATAIMMFPIGMAVIKQFMNESDTSETGKQRYPMILMLGIAYSASIGGIATLIGTPPNLVFSGIYSKYFPDQPEITFIRWMIQVLPLTIILFLLIWGYLGGVVLKTADIPNMQSRKYFIKSRDELGPLNRNQKWVLIIFGCTAFLWIFRADFDFGVFVIPGWSHLLGLQEWISDSTIAVGMAVLLFIIPAKTEQAKKTLLHWKSLLELPWDILLLFGGGFALADGFQNSGLAAYLADQMELLGELPLPLMLFSVTIFVVFLTELTSNTAVATTLLPVLAALTIRLEIPPQIIMLPATVAASCAFMLPVATPPNAIVYGSRYIPIQNMVKIGVVLNVGVSIICTAYFYLWFYLL
ncbi:MAG: SLC13 family permease [Calditrichia bacterium]